MLSYLFFFNDTATTEIYTLSLHDALPISERAGQPPREEAIAGIVRVDHDDVVGEVEGDLDGFGDRKSTRLNSSHANISYAVFCLKKKKTINKVAVVYSDFCIRCSHREIGR